MGIGCTAGGDRSMADFFQVDVNKSGGADVIWTDKNPGKSFDVVSGAIAELPDPEVHLIHDAAHWPQFEKADEVNRHHIDFLTRATD